MATGNIAEFNTLHLVTAFKAMANNADITNAEPKLGRNGKYWIQILDSWLPMLNGLIQAGQLTIIAYNDDEHRPIADQSFDLQMKNAYAIKQTEALNKWREDNNDLPEE